MEWINTEDRLPESSKRVIVKVESPFNGSIWTTIAEYVPKYTVLAEDFLDPDSDPDFSDIDEDGREYAPEGWYENTIESETSMVLWWKVKYWMEIPKLPEG